MPKPGGKYAASLLTQYIHIEAPPQAAVDILEFIILEQSWAFHVEARVLARQWLGNFHAQAVRLHNEAVASRSFINFTFSPASEEHIQGACFALPSDSEKIRADKRRRANAIPMLEVVRSLSPREFEYLCGLVLKCFQVERVNVSQSSGDQGIDFYGSAPFGDLIAQTSLPGAVEGPIQVWIVGQAKRYLSTTVSTADLRELVGSVELSKAKVHSALRIPTIARMYSDLMTRSVPF